MPGLSDEERLDVACRALTYHLVEFFADPEGGDFTASDFEDLMTRTGFMDSGREFTELYDRLMTDVDLR